MLSRLALILGPVRVGFWTHRAPLCGAALFAALFTLLSWAPGISLAQTREEKENVKVREAQRTSHVYQPASKAESKASIERRMRETAAEALARIPPPPERPAATDASSSSRLARLLSEHDWDADFENAGVVAGNLQLSLATPDTTYTYGHDYYLYLGLRNLSQSTRTLSGAPAHETLGRSDAMIFHVTPDEGESLALPNRYFDTANVHDHEPLVISATGRLVDLVDFNTLAATSPELLELTRRPGALRIVVELPSLGLRSNQAVVQVAP